jgi:1-acyl-sn-glycerol-3-phosphate acyltransferase
MPRFHYYVPIILQKIGYCLFFLLYKIFVRIEIRGRENLPELTKAEPIILAANHTHEMDVTAIPLILPFFSVLHPIYFVSNSTEKYKTFGWRSYIYGGVFFNILGGYASHSGHKNYGIALADHIRLLRKGRTMCIFPEGKRTRDGNMNPAHGGLGYMVYVTGATVIPVAIDTFFNMSLVDFLLMRRKVVITIGEQIHEREILPAIEDANANSPLPTVENFRHAGQIVLDRIKEILDDEL